MPFVVQNVIIFEMSSSIQRNGKHINAYIPEHLYEYLQFRVNISIPNSTITKELIAVLTAARNSDDRIKANKNCTNPKFEYDSGQDLYICTRCNISKFEH